VCLAHSGKSYTFTTKDSIRLRDLRAWAASFFSEHLLPYMPLKTATQKTTNQESPKDFDLLVQVLEYKEEGDFCVAKVCDSSGVAKLYVQKGWLNFSCKVVRVRSGHWNEDEEKPRLILKPYSNIMKVPAEFRAAKSVLMSVAISPELSVKRAIRPTLNTTLPELVTEITESNGIETTKLSVLLEKSALSRYKVNARVGFIEGTPADWLLVIDNLTKET
jgi:hypothetical protein